MRPPAQLQHSSGSRKHGSLAFLPAPSLLSPHGAASQPWLGWAESRLCSGKPHASCQATDVNLWSSRAPGPRLCSFPTESADPPPTRAVLVLSPLRSSCGVCGETLLKPPSESCLPWVLSCLFQGSAVMVTVAKQGGDVGSQTGSGLRAAFPSDQARLFSFFCHRYAPPEPPRTQTV